MVRTFQKNTKKQIEVTNGRRNVIMGIINGPGPLKYNTEKDYLQCDNQNPKIL